MAWTLKSIIPLTMVYCNVVFSSVHCIEFNRNITGVKFQPYVLNVTDANAVADADSLVTSYNFEEIKTMLKVISKRFSRVATSITSITDTYKKNVSYYKTYSEIYTAEAAATLNRETLLSNGSANFEVYTGMYLHTDPKLMNAEIKLAFESAQKSNQIHARTTVGFILFHNNVSVNSTIANFALLEANKIKHEAKILNLTLGIRANCTSYENISSTPEDMLDDLNLKRKLFVVNFDFIICYQNVMELYSLGVIKTFEIITNTALQFRKSIHFINPNIEFMVHCGTSTLGSTEEHYKFQLDFWKMMDEWGTQNNISIWNHEAFDNPIKMILRPLEAHYGWWKFKNGQDLTDVNDYEEKVSQFLETTGFGITSSETDTTSEPQVISDKIEQNSFIYIGSIIGPIIAVVAVTLLAVHYVRTNKLRRSLLTQAEVNGFVDGPFVQQDEDMQEAPIEIQALNKPYDKSFEISKNSFQICWSSILGSGEFGVVYKACIKASLNRNADTVALKMTKDDSSKTAVMSILREIKILLYLEQHDNIVSIKGAYTAEMSRGVVYVATELCELGSLKSFLKKLSKTDQKPKDKILQQYENVTGSVPNIEYTDMIRWSYEISCGMEYLAEKNVIHADLATRNVLLTANKIAKITDFGLSRRLYEYTEYVKKQQEPLPWRWMAIETLKKLEFSIQSDVWSFGVTLWEIFSMGDVPYPGVSWTLDFVSNLETGLRMKCPRLASQDIYALMSLCWEQEPQKLPTFTQLKQKISQMLESTRNDSDAQDN